ncbi:hypothetical protein ROHU_007129 [Labeo rohita]|uniref:Uncharacterized protein n=1 Tax=Labeo rohita TaxID=84645 RepID=A0A498MGH8_LABRO|nr:hypothetical protein ROHU_007129 [Labeo rohita]
MAAEKGTKSAAVLDFTTQSQGMTLEGALHPERAKQPPNEWRSSSSNKERNSHIGARPKQRNNRWDGTRGRQYSPGRHWEKSWDHSRPQESRWDRSWNPQTSSGSSGKGSWESGRNSKGKWQSHPGATSPRNRRKSPQRSHSDRAQTEPTAEPKTSPGFDSQELLKMMMQEFFKRQEEDRKWKKKEKPDSA